MSPKGKKLITPPAVNAAVRNSSIVEIVVGPDHTEFRVHKELLVRNSTYFRRVLEGPRKKAVDGVVRVVDVEEWTFDIFVNWLYDQKLPEKIPVPPLGIHDYWWNPEFMEGLKLLVLSYRFGVPSLRRTIHNYLIDFWDNNSNKVPHYKDIIYAFENLPSKSDVLRMLIDKRCQSWDGNPTEEETGLETQLPHAFLVGVMYKYAGGKYEEELDICSYHDHKSVLEMLRCPKFKGWVDSDDGSE